MKPSSVSDFVRVFGKPDIWTPATFLAVVPLGVKGIPLGAPAMHQDSGEMNTRLIIPAYQRVHWAIQTAFSADPQFFRARGISYATVLETNRRVKEVIHILAYRHQLSDETVASAMRPFVEYLEKTRP